MGYWTLLVVKNCDRSLLYLDPLKRYDYMDGLLGSLLQFLKGELVYHMHKRIEHTAWRDVFYRENSEVHRFSHSESALYILKHAECFAKCNHRDLTSSDLQNYGQQALLKAIPSGIRVPRNPWLWRHFFMHTAIVNTVGFTASLWLASIPLAHFPISFGPAQRRYTCLPDYASGKVVTVVKTNLRYVEAV